LACASITASFAVAGVGIGVAAAGAAFAIIAVIPAVAAVVVGTGGAGAVPIILGVIGIVAAGGSAVTAVAGTIAAVGSGVAAGLGVDLCNRDAQWFPIPNTATYQDAANVCSKNGRTICNRDEYCPLGHSGGETPFLGFQNVPWAPVGDDTNNWVSVSATSWPSCQLHTEIAGGQYGHPAWGTDPTPVPWRGVVLCCVGAHP